MPIRKCFVLEWYGPFSYDELDKYVKENANLKFRFYAISGLCSRQRGEPIWQYCGITERLITQRFKDKDHKIKNITRDKEIWLGRFSNPMLSNNRNIIELVEHLIICSYELSLNEKKTKTFPKEPIGIFNLWFNKNKERRLRKICAVQKEMSDTIIFDGLHIWTGDKLKPWM